MINKRIILIASILFFVCSSFILYYLIVTKILPLGTQVISILRYNGILFSFSFDDEDYISENQKKLNILHYDLSFDLFPEEKYFDAFVEITGVVTDTSVRQIDLNFYDNFDIKLVELNNLAVQFEISDKRFSVPFNPEQSDTFRLKIIYSGTPESVGLEGFVFGKRNNYSLVYTLSEPNFASSWFPCNDIPDDKSLIDMRITNDSARISVSNGKLVDVFTQNARRTYHWKTVYPVSTYLVALYSADYKTFSEEYVTENKTDTMQIQYYVLPDRLEKSKTDFEVHRDILNVFSKLFGEYPFIEEKYAVAEFLWSLGAMENQTITGVASNLITGNKFFTDYLVHELAHHWWGNAVGPKTWKDIWLNEGFSSYSEALYFEQIYGNEALQSTMTSKYSKNFRGKLSDPGANIFSTTVYNKGAWVLHMLRWEVGDSVFFSILKNYFNTFKYSNASTNDFISLAQNVSGRNLENFFHQWLDYEGEIKISYKAIIEQDGTDFKTKIKIQQIQNQPEYYTFPLEVELILDDEKIIRDKFFIDSKISEIEMTSDSKPNQIILDPDGWLLGTFKPEENSK